MTIVNQKKILKENQTQLENKFEERNSELQALNAQAPFGMCVFSPEGFVLLTNKAWNKIWDITGELNDYIVFNDPVLTENGYIPPIKKIFTDGGQLVTQPVYYEDTNNRLPGKINDRWLEHRFYSVHNPQGRISRIVELIEDVTERKKAEEIKEELTNQKFISAVIIETIENERKRLSKEIHDGIGQILTAAKLSIELFEKKRGISDNNLQEAKKLIYNAGEEVENVINALHPMIIDSHGLISSLEILCKDFEDLTNIRIRFNAYDFTKRLIPKLELNIFRIVQEAVSNIAKHSKASKASVQLYNRDDAVLITIEDNGIGFTSDVTKKATTRKSGFGITSMIERVNLLNGKIIFETKPNRGTEIHIDIPAGEIGKNGKN